MRLHSTQCLASPAKGLALVVPCRSSSRRNVKPLSGSASSACSTSASDGPSEPAPARTSRRHALGAAIAAAILTSQQGAALAGNTQVGTYLPAFGVEDLVKFVPTPQKTPGLRSGIVPPFDPYSFALPPAFKEAMVSNTQSGNFCLPNCGEPWTEVIFTDDKAGRIAVLIYPLVKLTNAKGITIEGLGTPEALLPRIGSFLTGTYLDEEDVISSSKEKMDDGRMYYFYEVNAPAANGHSLSAITIKGDLAYLFLVSATDKQWSRSEAKLRSVVKTFRA